MVVMTIQKAQIMLGMSQWGLSEGYIKGREHMVRRLSHAQTLGTGEIVALRVS